MFSVLLSFHAPCLNCDKAKMLIIQPCVFEVMISSESNSLFSHKAKIQWLSITVFELNNISYVFCFNSDIRVLMVWLISLCLRNTFLFKTFIHFSISVTSLNIVFILTRPSLIIGKRNYVIVIDTNCIFQLCSIVWFHFCSPSPDSGGFDEQRTTFFILSYKIFFISEK